LVARCIGPECASIDLLLSPLLEAATQNCFVAIPTSPLPSPYFFLLFSLLLEKENRVVCTQHHFFNKDFPHSEHLTQNPENLFLELSFLFPFNPTLPNLVLSHQSRSVERETTTPLTVQYFHEV
jgi:hypothetical protein